MGLPNPLPDDPRKWDGWRNFQSENPYERLCFLPAEEPNATEIEEAFQTLYIWWQKKLPLRNQHSNPLSQLLRSGLDEAQQKLSEAKALLLDPEQRARWDALLETRRQQDNVREFEKMLKFLAHDSRLSSRDRTRLFTLGNQLGLENARIEAIIEQSGTVAEPDAPQASPHPHHGSEEEFARLLRMANLHETGATADHRRAFESLGTSMGLDDDQIERVMDAVIFGDAPEPAVKPPTQPAPQRPNPAAPPSPRTPAVARVHLPPRELPRTEPLPQPYQASSQPPPQPAHSPERERLLYPPFTNSLGIDMLFIPSGEFVLGSPPGSGAPANECPQTRVFVPRFFIASVPVTNIEFEQFDPKHSAKRLLNSDDSHPAIFVSFADATRFCQWLSQREKRTYRLPTEAEWEYAATGGDNRPYPWGRGTVRGDVANFADASTRLPWRDPNVDDGWPQTSPVGSYPLGSSPFGTLDMAGNVWEWCLGFYTPYPGGKVRDWRGASNGTRRVFRGGSWRSRFSNITTTFRGMNTPDYIADDLGFRLVCECPAQS